MYHLTHFFPYSFCPPLGLHKFNKYLFGLTTQISLFNWSYGDLPTLNSADLSPTALSQPGLDKTNSVIIFDEKVDFVEYIAPKIGNVNKMFKLLKLANFEVSRKVSVLKQAI